MPRTCWAPGCRTGYDSNSTAGRHFFTVTKNRLKEWSCQIPRKGAVRPFHMLCDLHFEDRFIIEWWVFDKRSKCGECDSGQLLLTCETLSSATSVHPGDIELMCDSDDTTPQNCIFYYVSGFIAYKLIKFTQCVECLESVSNWCDSNSSEAQLVVLRTYLKLQFPSAQLWMLLVEVEHCIIKHSLSACLHNDVTDDIVSSDVASHAIGCDIYHCSLTFRAVHLYALTRLHFLNRSHNRKLTSRQEKHK